MIGTNGLFPNQLMGFHVERYKWQNIETSYSKLQTSVTQIFLGHRSQFTRRRLPTETSSNNHIPSPLKPSPRDQLCSTEITPPLQTINTLRIKTLIPTPSPPITTRTPTPPHHRSPPPITAPIRNLTRHIR